MTKILWRFDGNEHYLNKCSERYEYYKSIGVLPCVASSAAVALTEQEYSGKSPSGMEVGDIQSVEQKIQQVGGLNI